MYGDLKVFSGSSHPDLANKICQNLGIPISKSETIKFSNENMMVKIHENVRGADVFVIQTSCSPVSDNIMELLIMIDALKHSSAGRITAVMPYFPYSRSDKKDQPRISITARLMADLLETAGADRVLTLDLHSAQVQGFFRIPADQLKSVGIFTKYWKTQDIKNVVLVAGDAGEAKGLGAFANRLNLPMAIIDKRRYGNDEKAKAVNIIGEVKGKVGLIVDDEIATGGTIIEATDFLLKEGIKEVSVTCTHPVLSGKAIEKIKNSKIKELVTSDSIPIPKEKMLPNFKILSVAKLFAKAIQCIHTGESVSSLFD